MDSALAGCYFACPEVGRLSFGERCWRAMRTQIRSAFYLDKEGGLAMSPTRVMLIRHAEKPTLDVAGVAPNGTPDAESLTPRGWQRSGALVRFFNPVTPMPDTSPIATPGTVFAAGVGEGSKSQRSLQTVDALAQSLQPLGVPFKTGYLKDDVDAMVQNVLGCQGVVLIAWEHKLIPSIVTVLSNNAITPAPWPGERFDMVWVLDAAGGEWTFNQVPQRLLPGDQP